MMKVLRAALGSLLAVAAVVACGSSDSGGSGGSSSSDNFITQYCELLNPCCQRAGLPTDGKQCRTLYTAVAGSAEYDAAAGEQCLAAIRRTSSTADFCTTSQSPRPWRTPLSTAMLWPTALAWRTSRPPRIRPRPRLLMGRPSWRGSAPLRPSWRRPWGTPTPGLGVGWAGWGAFPLRCGVFEGR